MLPSHGSGQRFKSSVAHHSGGMRKIILSFFLISLLFSFQRYTLKNGAEVIYQEDHDYPLVSAVIAIKAGSSYEAQGEKGLSHFLEHMLFDGTLRRSREELENAFANIGTYYNAFTRKDFVSFEFSSPPSQIIPAMRLISEMIFMSSFPPAEFKKEKGVVYQEIVKDYLNPMESSGYKFYENWLEGTPYETPVLGYPTIVKNLKRERVMNFWRKLYAPFRMKLVIVGDFHFKNIEDELERIFSVNRKEAEIPLPEINPKWNKIELANSKLKRIDIALEASSLCQKGSGAYEILAPVIGDKIALGLGMNNYESYYEKHRGISFIHFYGFPYRELNKEEVKKSISQALKSSINQEEIEKARKEYLSSRIFINEKKLQLAREIGKWEILCSEERREAFLREINATSLQDEERALKGIKKYYALIQQPVKEKIFSEKIPRVSLKKLKNGLRYALIGSEEEIKAYHILVERRAEKESFPGQAHLLFKTLELQHRDFLEERGISYQFTDNPYFPFDDYYLSKDYSYMRFVGRDEKEISRAVCRVMEQPLKEKAFKEARKKILGELEYLSRKRSWVGEEKMRFRLLSPPFNFPLYGNAKLVSSSTFKSLISFKNRYFSPSNIIFTGVGGKIVPDCLKRLRNQKGISVPFRDSLKPSGKIRGGIFGLGWKVAWDNGSYPSYLLLAHILRDRIVEVVRERKGLAYSVSFYFYPFSNHQGLMVLLIPTTKVDVPDVEEAAQKVLSSFNPMKLGKEEFKRYKISLAARVLRYGERKINRAYYMGFFIHLGLGPEYMWKLPSIVDSLRVEDIGRAFSSMGSPVKISLAGELR